MAFTADISKETYMVDINTFFPSFGTTDKIKNSSGDGINNIKGLIISMIPMITTMMAIGATLMIVWWGFNMVLGGASTEQTESWKSIMKDAIIGLVVWLLAYVIIAFIWNIFNI